MSPNRTKRPVVGGTPPSSGWGAWNCHLRSPLSALLAVIQPDHIFGSSCLPNPWVAPLQGLPAGEFPRVFTGTACTVVHHSTSPVKIRFSAGSKAAPFHSAPPCDPGQNRVPCGLIGDSAFVTVVTGLRKITLPVFRSIKYKWPSLGASANIRWP